LGTTNKVEGMTSEEERRKKEKGTGKKEKCGKLFFIFSLMLFKRVHLILYVGWQ